MRMAACKLCNFAHESCNVQRVLRNLSGKMADMDNGQRRLQVIQLFETEETYEVKSCVYVRGHDVLSCIGSPVINEQPISNPQPVSNIP